MKELLREHRVLFEKGCDFVALFFLDENKITACLCSQKEIASACYNIDSKRENAPVFHRIFKNVGERGYYFNFFTLQADGDSCVSFDNLPLVTASQFPVCSALCSYATVGERVAYIEDNTLVLATPTKELLKRLEKAHKKSYRAHLRRAGLGTRLKVYFIRVLHTLLRPFFKKEVWLIADRCDCAGDNGQSFFEHLCQNPVAGVQPYFVINKKSRDYKAMKKIGKVLSPRTLKFKLYTTFATRVIASQLEYDIVNPFSFDIYLKDILKKRKIVFLQHGIIKDDLSPTYNRYERQIDMFVTSTEAEYNSIVNSSAYGFDKNTVKLTGLARYDKLTSSAEKIVFIAPSWRKYCLESTDTRKLIPDFKNSSFFKFYSELLHNKRLIETAGANGYSLCFYPHFLLGSCKDEIGALDPVFINGDSYTYNDIFKRGALLLTDYSSIQFDFAYLKKPIIYCQFDKDEFFASHNYIPGYFSYERDGFGPITYTVEDTVSLLCHYMERCCPLESEYESRINMTFKYKDKESSKRILNEVLKIK